MIGQQLCFAAEMMLVHKIGASAELTQIAAMRAIGGLVLAIALSRGKLKGVLYTKQPLVHLLRSLCTAGYLWVFAFGFTHLPLADAAALTYSAAIYIVLLSPFVLGESPGLRHWIAVGLGCAGALLIIKPGFNSFSGAYLVVLLGSSLNGLAFVLTRRLERQDSSVTVMFYASLLSTAVFAPSLLNPMTVAPWMASLFVLGPVGLYFGIVALQYSEASSLAPLTYLQLVLVGIGAFFLFDERPDSISLLGGTIIFTGVMLVALPALLTEFRMKIRRNNNLTE